MSTRKKIWLILVLLPFVSGILFLATSFVFYIINIMTSDTNLWAINPNSSIYAIKSIINRVLGMISFLWIIWLIPGIIMLAMWDKKDQTKQPLPAELRLWWFWERVLASAIDTWLWYLLIPAFFNLYYYFAEWDTIWYKIMWLKILDRNTFALPDWWALFWRHFAKILSGLPFCLWYLRAARDQEKQAFHDKLADTIVIKYRKTNRRLAIPIVLICIILIVGFIWLSIAWSTQR